MPSTNPNLKSLQDGLVRLLGAHVDQRAALVATMLRRDAGEATAYWLQLCVSVGIATFGLVLGSAAVIIGAMLVAPLMGPILALAMGLAVGSPFLVLRASGRILLSVVIAVGGSASITLLLPYHELTQELAARTAPTALDLLTAGFCALAGVYATLRPGSDTTTTAAGTSIGISLVPPLCACGYGVGVRSVDAATGAALLFLANLVAIIFVGTLGFAAAGFTRVAASALDREELARAPGKQLSTTIARRLAMLFESRFGPFARFLMPLLLLGAVYVPLRRALDEVAWQVRTRAQIHATIKREPHRIVESRVRVERRDVEVQLVLLGSAADAEATRKRLNAEMLRAGVLNPRVDVFAVPDAEAFAGLESSLRPNQGIGPAVEVPRLAAQHEFDSVRSEVERLWPTRSSGAPLVIQISTPDHDSLKLQVTHVGAPLGPDARESLQRSLESSLARRVSVVDAAIKANSFDATAGDLDFVADVASAAVSLQGSGELTLCVTRPDAATESPRDRAIASALSRFLADRPGIVTSTGNAWRARIVRGKCTGAEGSVNGADDGGSAGAPAL